MAKFSFANKLWKTKDAQWLAERNEKWLVAEKILANGNNSELASLKNILSKGSGLQAVVMSHIMIINFCFYLYQVLTIMNCF